MYSVHCILYIVHFTLCALYIDQTHLLLEGMGFGEDSNDFKRHGNINSDGKDRVISLYAVRIGS